MSLGHTLREGDRASEIDVCIDSHLIGRTTARFYIAATRLECPFKFYRDNNMTNER